MKEPYIQIHDSYRAGCLLQQDVDVTDFFGQPQPLSCWGSKILQRRGCALPVTNVHSGDQQGLCQPEEPCVPSRAGPERHSGSFLHTNCLSPGLRYS